MEERRRQRADWIDHLVAESEGPVMVQLSLETGVAFPVEVFADHGPGFVGPVALGVSQQLEQGLLDWLLWWKQRVSPGGDEVVGGDESEWRQFGREAARLREALQQELGNDFVVRCS